MAKILKQIAISEELLYLHQTPTLANAADSKENNDREDHQEAFISELQASIKKQAHEEGYHAGFSQGIREGEQQAATQAAMQLQQLDNLLQTLPTALAESRQALKTDIADIVLLIVQQFFVQQQQNKEAIVQQITQVLEQINSKQNLTLALHPQDLALLQQKKITIDFNKCQDVHIVADENLHLGGCWIKSEHGLFDASIERQIDRLKQVLLQIKHGDNHG